MSYNIAKAHETAATEVIITKLSWGVEKVETWNKQTNGKWKKEGSYTQKTGPWMVSQIQKALFTPSIPASLTKFTIDGVNIVMSDSEEEELLAQQEADRIAAEAAIETERLLQEEAKIDGSLIKIFFERGFVSTYTRVGTKWRDNSSGWDRKETEMRAVLDAATDAIEITLDGVRIGGQTEEERAAIQEAKEAAQVIADQVQYDQQHLSEEVRAQRSLVPVEDRDFDHFFTDYQKSILTPERIREMRDLNERQKKANRMIQDALTSGAADKEAVRHQRLRVLDIEARKEIQQMGRPEDWNAFIRDRIVARLAEAIDAGYQVGRDKYQRLLKVGDKNFGGVVVSEELITSLESSAEIIEIVLVDNRGNKLPKGYKKQGDTWVYTGISLDNSQEHMGVQEMKMKIKGALSTPTFPSDLHSFIIDGVEHKTSETEYQREERWLDEEAKAAQSDEAMMNSLKLRQIEIKKFIEGTVEIADWQESTSEEEKEAIQLHIERTSISAAERARRELVPVEDRDYDHFYTDYQKQSVASQGLEESRRQQWLDVIKENKRIQKALDEGAAERKAEARRLHLEAVARLTKEATEALEDIGNIDRYTSEVEPQLLKKLSDAMKTGDDVSAKLYWRMVEIGANAWRARDAAGKSMLSAESVLEEMIKLEKDRGGDITTSDIVLAVIDKGTYDLYVNPHGHIYIPKVFAGGLSAWGKLTPEERFNYRFEAEGRPNDLLLRENLTIEESLTLSRLFTSGAKSTLSKQHGKGAAGYVGDHATGVYINVQEDFGTSGTVLLHETGHAIDVFLNRMEGRWKFTKAIPEVVNPEVAYVLGLTVLSDPLAGRKYSRASIESLAPDAVSYYTEEQIPSEYFAMAMALLLQNPAEFRRDAPKTAAWLIGLMQDDEVLSLLIGGIAEHLKYLLLLLLKQ